MRKSRDCGDLQTHAEAQQEQIRVAEMLIQRQVTGSAAFLALSKYTGNHCEYHDWSFSVRRKLTRADERFPGLLLQWISGQIDEVNVNDVLEYRRTTDLSSTDMDWLNSELHALLAIKTYDTAMAFIKSLEESLAGNAWNVKCEVTIDIVWRFSRKEC